MALEDFLPNHPYYIDPTDPDALDVAAKKVRHFGVVEGLRREDLADILSTHAQALRMKWKLKKAERVLRRLEAQIEELKEELWGIMGDDDG